jgi:nucleoside-diphosphate-sugar epimerase
MGEALIRFAAGRLRAYVPGGFTFVAARDIVEGHLLAMAKGRPGQKYIFGSAFLTFDELMALFSAVTGKPPPRRVPAAVMAVAAEVAALVMPRLMPKAQQLLTPAAIRILRQNRRANTSKAQQELGFRPTPIEAAVREAYDWFVAQGVISPPPVVGRLAAELHR